MEIHAIAAHLGQPAERSGWATEAKVRTIAGAIILVSLGLSLLNHGWLWLTAFVGANLLQSGVTGWCLMSNLLTLGRRNKAVHDA